MTGESEPQTGYPKEWVKISRRQ